LPLRKNEPELTPPDFQMVISARKKNRNAPCPRVGQLTWRAHDQGGAHLERALAADTNDSIEKIR
jgi:hypothetical protein